MNAPPRDDDTEEERRGALRPVFRSRVYLFVVFEADRPFSGGARFSIGHCDEILIRRGPERRAVAESARAGSRLVVELAGRAVSAAHARIERQPQGWALSDMASTNGCYVNGVRVQQALLAPDDLIEIGRTYLMIRSCEQAVDEEPSHCDSRDREGELPALLTLLPDLERRLRELRRVARSRVSVTVNGESGTGKELLARALHQLSDRPGEFVAVNCGALTESLAQAQLFGHVRGAFSGAVTDAPGFIRSAHGGTLLLDEVQELSRQAQAALLRVAQEREVVPVGAARPHTVDVRFIATSPKPLQDAMDSGNFRPDLFARLSGFSFFVVPLRERRADMGVLIAAILRKACASESDGLRFTPDFTLRLLSHPWGLNIRELEQTVLRGLTLAENGVIDADEPRMGAGAEPGRELLSPHDAELRERLVRELCAANGNIAKVARALDKAPMQVRRWLKRFAIDPRSYRG